MYSVSALRCGLATWSGRCGASPAYHCPLMRSDADPFGTAGRLITHALECLPDIDWCTDSRKAFALAFEQPRKIFPSIQPSVDPAHER